MWEFRDRLTKRPVRPICVANCLFALVACPIVIGCSNDSTKTTPSGSSASNQNQAESSQARGAGGAKKKTVIKGFDSSQPVVYTKKWNSRFDENRDLIEFWSLGIEHYQESSSDSDDRKREVVHWMQQTIENMLPTSFQLPHSWEDLYRQAESLLDDDWKQGDPFILLLTAYAAYYTAHFDRSSDLVFQSLVRFRPSDYPMRFVVNAPLLQQYLLPLGEYDRTRQYRVDEVSDSIQYWLLNDFRAKPDEHQFVMRFIMWHMDHARRQGKDLANFVSSLVNNTRVPPWIREMINAHYHWGLAWNTRRAAWGADIDIPGQNFAENITLAAKHARAATKINANFGEAHALLLRVALLGHGDQLPAACIQELFDSQLDMPHVYTYIHNQTTRQHVNSIDELIELGVTCFETGRYDTVVPFELIEIILMTLREFPDEAKTGILGNENIYNKMRHCLGEYAKQAASDPDSAETVRFRKAEREIYWAPDFFLTMRAILSHRFGHDDDAIQDVLELKEDLNDDAFAYAGEQLSSQFFRAKLYVMETDRAKIGLQLEELFTVHDRQHRIENAETIRNLVESGVEESMDPIEKGLFKMYRRRFEYESKYDRGEWVDLKFSDGLIDWKSPRFSNIKVESDSTVLLDTSWDPVAWEFFLRPMAAFPGNKTIEAEFEVFDPNDKPANWYPGFSVLANDKYRGTYISIARQKGVVVVGDRQSRSMFLRVAGKWPAKQKVTINISDELCEVFINDQHVVNVDRFWVENGAIIQLSQYRNRNGRGRARVSNLRVRRWNVDKPSLFIKGMDDFTFEQAEEYFTQAQQAFPDQPYYAYRLAIIHFNAGRFARAAEFAQQALANGFPVNDLRLFIGFAADQKNETGIAAEWYAKPKETNSLVASYWHGGEENINQPQFVAEAYLLWLIATAPDAEPGRHDLSEFTDGKPAKNVRVFNGSGKAPQFVEQPKGPTCRHPTPWVKARIDAAGHAYVGQFGPAVSILEEFVHRVPLDSRDEYRDQMAAYRNGRVWKRPIDSRPFYLSIPTHVAPRSQVPWGRWVTPN